MISQMLSQNQDLQEQTRKWGEEQLTDPSRSDETRDRVRESQSEMEAQFDALKDMLEREIAQQEDSPLKAELQDLLDALEGKEFNAGRFTRFCCIQPARNSDSTFSRNRRFCPSPSSRRLRCSQEPSRLGQSPPESASPQSQSPPNEKPSAQAPSQPEGGNPLKNRAKTGSPARSSTGKTRKRRMGLRPLRVGKILPRTSKWRASPLNRGKRDCGRPIRPPRPHPNPVHSRTCPPDPKRLKEG